MKMTDLYPQPDPTPEPQPRVRTSLVLNKSTVEDVEFFADLWSEYDRLNRADRRKWQNQSVMERMVVAAIDGLWDQMGVSRPTNPEERAALLKRLSAQYQRDRVVPVESRAQKRAPKQSQ